MLQVLEVVANILNDLISGREEWLKEALLEKFGAKSVFKEDVLKIELGILTISSPPYTRHRNGERVDMFLTRIKEIKQNE